MERWGKVIKKQGSSAESGDRSVDLSVDLVCRSQGQRKRYRKDYSGLRSWSLTGWGFIVPTLKTYKKNCICSY